MSILVLERGNEVAELLGSAPIHAPVRVSGNGRAVFDELIAGHMPQVLVVDARLLDDGLIARFRWLARIRRLPSTVLYLTVADVELFRRAWRVRDVAIELSTSPAELVRRVGSLSCSARPALRAFLRRVGTPSRITERLLDRLAAGEGPHATSADLAAALGVSRTVLYASLSRSGLPPAEQLQFLFRILPAIEALQGGGTLEAAAPLAGYADARALRKALRARLGLSITEVRGRPGWRWIAKRCLERADPARGADAGTSESGRSDLGSGKPLPYRSHN